jgi:hypothetical protein
MDAERLETPKQLAALVGIAEAAPLPLRGRKRIAFAVGRSERTISRWIKKGILPPLKAGPFRNSILEFRDADLERLTHRDQGEGD